MHATVTLRVRNDMKLRWPMGETKTHMICMGFSPDLDEAARLATLHAVEYLTSTGLDRDDAYTLSSLMVDLHVTQLVNGVKGVHAMIPKSILGRKSVR
jgi:acetamidase/formamidase